MRKKKDETKNGKNFCTLKVGNGDGVSIRGLLDAGSLPFLTTETESRTSSLLLG